MRLFGVVVVLFFHFGTNYSLTCGSTTASSSPSVIIVGAGLSGILAAKTLHDAGIRDFLILEGNHKIGGRLCKHRFGKNIVELGANWLFDGGPKPNLMMEVAREIKLKTFYSDFGNVSSNTYKQEGGLYPKHLVEKSIKASEDSAEFCGEISKILSTKEDDVDISILAAQRLNKHIPKTPLDMLIDYYSNDFEDAQPPSSTSVKHTFPRDIFNDFGEDRYFVADPRGFESVAFYFARKFLVTKNGYISDPRLELNKVVREIQYTNNGVAMSTEDGSTYKAKYAIISVSLGVLQSNLIEFKPNLPLWKKLAISDFSMAIYTKIFLRFPYTFWPIGGPHTEFFLYANENRGYYPVWQHLENEFPRSNVLFVTVTDEESKRIEHQPQKQTIIEIMKVLKKIFGNNIPEPQEILIPRWWSNKLFRGSFAIWPSRYTQKSHDQLGEPVGPIYFTGEHLSNKYMGYTNGAYYEGINTAKDLINCVENKRCGACKEIIWTTSHLFSHNAVIIGILVLIVMGLLIGYIRNQLLESVTRKRSGSVIIKFCFDYLLVEVCFFDLEYGNPFSVV